MYYWSVDIQNAGGTVLSSERKDFATAVGTKFTSTNLIWSAEGNSSLIRARVAKADGVSKALLTVTALGSDTVDTSKSSGRYIFTAFVNHQEIGVGPTRRSSSKLFYNTYDITEQLAKGKANVLGLFSYASGGTVSPGVLMQLTYFYSDGTSSVVYNSGSDVQNGSASTQVMSMDDIVYGTSGDSIGTQYYTENAQNVDVSSFPASWCDPDQVDGVDSGFKESSAGWEQPKSFGLPTTYKLSPSIVSDMKRSLVSVGSITRKGKGIYTIAFNKEIIGDIRLTVTVPDGEKQAVRVTEGEQLSSGVAKYKMGTGNVYDETWTFSGGTSTFTGFSLRGFRYVTLYNFPGELTANDIKGVKVSLSTADSEQSLSTGVEILDDVAELSQYTYEATTLDTVVDSVTRERRPYEGDALIYQALSYQNTDDYMTVRNTWNWLLDNPSQYTEYRLMTAIGIYRDYAHTNDAEYIKEVYEKLKQQVDSTVVFNSSTGLVKSNGTTDLVDWPRSELNGYDMGKTVYKTIVNAVAVGAYQSLSKMASAIGETDDATYYSNRSNMIRSSLLERTYNSSTHLFSDGLTSEGKRVGNFSQQNSYFALYFGIYSDSSMADSIALACGGRLRQKSGSIYAAFFFYEGLVKSGNADIALSILRRTDSSDERTYWHVINVLGATIAPEAWSQSSKPNMTFSHAWGVGGGVGLCDGIVSVDMEDDDADGVSYSLLVQGDGLSNATVSLPLPWGASNITLTNLNGTMAMSTTVPQGQTVRVVVPKASSESQVFIDGQSQSIGGDVAYLKDGRMSVLLTSGSHTVQVTSLTVRTLPQKSDSGVDTLAVRRGNAYYMKNSISSGVADKVITFGRSSDAVLVGDWDGDGKDTLAVRRGNAYYIKNSISGGEADKTVRYGTSSDAVLVGDWDGDGVDTLAVRRGNAYYFKNSISSGTADKVIAFGKGSDAMLVGDWDGDGKDTLAVRRGNAYYIKNSISSGVADKVITFGKGSDAVLVGDWDGDGKDTLAVRRGNAYYIKNSISSGVADKVITFGRAKDTVLVGDWDGE